MKYLKYLLLCLLTICAEGQINNQGGSVTTYNIDNIIYLDGSKYATAQAAINAVGNCGTLVIPPGTYTPVNTSTSLIVVPATETCLRIQGSGKGVTILDCSSLTSAVACITNSNGGVQYTDIVIENLTIKGPVSTSLDSRLIDFQWCVRCRVEGNVLLNGSFGVTFGSSLSSDNQILMNYMSGMNQQGISVSGTNLEIVGNHVYNIDTTNLSALHHGIYVQGGDGTLIANNFVQNVPGFCIQAFSQTTGQSIVNYRVVGNDCKQGGQAASGTKGGIAFAETAPATGIRQGIVNDNTISTTNGNCLYLSSVTDLEVIGNTIRTCTGADAILVQASSSFSTAKVTVSNNTVSGVATNGNGIRLTVGGGTALQHCIVSNNIVDTVFAVGIYLSTVTDSMIYGNRVMNYNTQANSSNAGILLDSTSVRNMILLNEISTATGTAVPIQTAAAADVDNIIALNNVMNNATPTISGSGTRTFIGFNKRDATDVSINVPGIAGTLDIGTGALPWANVWMGTAATNNFKIQPSSTTGARILNIPDWGIAAATTQNQPFTVVLTSQYTNSTTTFTNVAGGNTIQFPVLANTTYTAECHLFYQAAATGGLNIEFTGPASPTAVAYGLDDPSAATTFNSAVATAYSTSLGQVIGTAATNFDATVSFALVNGANAGTVNMLAKSSAAAQLQIQIGSFCRVQ